jgi:hypothetical protein
VTTHPPGTGGELVVAHRNEAHGISEIDADATEIFPIAGQLIFFDARDAPHYVRELRAEEDTRVVVAMNYFTQNCNETNRPPDLNRHLFGEE